MKDTPTLTELVTEQEGAEKPEEELEESQCCICGETRDSYTVDDVFSDAFTGASATSARARCSPRVRRTS